MVAPFNFIVGHPLLFRHASTMLNHTLHSFYHCSHSRARHSERCCSTVTTLRTTWDGACDGAFCHRSVSSITPTSQQICTKLLSSFLASLIVSRSTDQPARPPSSARHDIPRSQSYIEAVVDFHATDSACCRQFSVSSLTAADHHHVIALTGLPCPRAAVSASWWSGVRRPTRYWDCS